MNTVRNTTFMSLVLPLMVMICSAQTVLGDSFVDLAITGQTTDDVRVLLGYGDGSFGPHVDYSVGDTPFDMATGDYNTDGNLDIAVTNYNSDCISVLFGDGYGRFTYRADFRTGNNPDYIVAGDFNEDDFLDLAYTVAMSWVEVLPGDGAGSFGEPLGGYLVGSHVKDLVAGDFDEDGFLDLVVAVNYEDSVAVLLGYGNGSFLPPQCFSAGPEPRDIIAADFNDDTNLDVAVTNYLLYGYDNAVSVLFGDGAGSFGPETNYFTGYATWGITTGDFNDDDMPDIAVTNRVDNDISVLLNDGYGHFWNRVDYPVGDYPIGIVTDDFDEDNILDLAVANYYDGDITFWYGNGLGGFESREDYPLESQPRYIITANFNSATPPYPDVDLTLTPYNPPITIPVSGGSFDYNIEVLNNENYLIPADVWINVILPDGSLLEPVVGPVLIEMPIGFTINRDRTQAVPENAPAGEYIYQAFVGIYPVEIWASDSFTFVKLGSIGGDGLAGWYNTGEAFGEMNQNVSRIAPANFALLAAYPNPFNPSTVISYQLQTASLVNLTVYDVTGRQVAELINGWRDAGAHEVTFDANALASGVYLYYLNAGALSATGKMVLMK